MSRTSLICSSDPLSILLYSVPFWVAVWPKKGEGEEKEVGLLLLQFLPVWWLILCVNLAEPQWPDI